MKKYIALFGASIENLKILKYHTFQKKTLVLSVICSKWRNKDENIFKEKELIEILNILRLFQNVQLS